jgi:hypothetical protein
MQLSWALSRLCLYLDPKADKDLPQVKRMRELMGVPGERLIDLFSDWLVASTIKLNAQQAIRTVDGSYVDGFCRPVKASDIKKALKAEAERLAREKRGLPAAEPPKDEPKLPSDRDAWPRTITRPAGGTKHVMGYVVTTQRMVSPDREYIEKVRVGPANHHEYDQGLAMLRRSLEEGTPIDYMLADRGFSQIPDYRQGVRALDVDLVFDLKSDQRGRDGRWEGCLVIDGWPYLPSLPVRLRRIKSLAINASRTQKEKWRAQMKERERYALDSKERKSASRVRVTSPALRTPSIRGKRGPGCSHPKLLHTLRFCDPKLAVCPGDHAAGEACGLLNATWSADFSLRTERNFSAVPYGSSAWQKLYPARSSSERGFNILKNSDMVGLLKGRIRWRGTMRVTLLMTMAMASHNLWLTNVPAAAASPPQKWPMVMPLAA